MTQRDRLSLLYDESTIARRVDELAESISRDYAEADELYVVGVLKGAFIFLADLARRLSIPRRVDFIAVSSYEGTTASGDVRLVMDLRESTAGRHVLIVDDILDTGKTLHYSAEMLSAREPASLRTCVLTRKIKSGQRVSKVDYVGFEIPDVWVVGYGLDYADRYRTLPYIAKLERR